MGVVHGDTAGGGSLAGRRPTSGRPDLVASWPAAGPVASKVAVVSVESMARRSFRGIHGLWQFSEISRRAVALRDSRSAACPWDCRSTGGSSEFPVGKWILGVVPVEGRRVGWGGISGHRVSRSPFRTALCGEVTALPSLGHRERAEQRISHWLLWNGARRGSWSGGPVKGSMVRRLRRERYLKAFPSVAKRTLMSPSTKALVSGHSQWVRIPSKSKRWWK